MQQRTVEISNIGPIKRAKFTLVPGMNVLKGPNGIGKTRALEAVSSLTHGQGQATPRDGATRGEAEGFGATLKVGRRVTHGGELDVVSIEGRFDLSHLVDPGIKANDAADAQRIKALVQLAGGSGADPALFYGMVGGQKEFEHYISPSATDTDDIVTMAGRIKRDLEKHARLASDEAEREVAGAEAARALVADVDLNGPDDGPALQGELEFAIAEFSRLGTQANAITRQVLAAETARTQLAAASTSYQGASVRRAQDAETVTSETSEAANAEVLKLEALLHEARNAAQIATMQHENAVTSLRTAIEHEQTLTAWRTAIDEAAKVEPIAPELIEAAAADVTAARAAQERGTLVRLAKQKAANADEHMKRAAECRRVSDWLRDAGKATDEVLSDLVGKLGCPLRVSGGRLVTDHSLRGETFYSELSMGERTKIALNIATDAVGPNGLIVIPQEFWEGLDPDNRQMTAEHMRDTGVYGISAEADLGELRAEVA
jgi:hypothetical protein